MAQLPCPLCAGQAELLGRVADGDFFAGRVLETAIPGGRLWRCRRCRSMFKDSPLPSARYSALYAQGYAEQWTGLRQRRDFELAAAVVARHAPGGAVLDLGCGAGEWLSTLPLAHARFGIEPSAAAADLARARGVTVLGPDLGAIGTEWRFDAIALIDVIEHVGDVPGLLRSVAALLRPGGLLLISTGDPLCRPWSEVFGARFWYASFPEHIVFPSRLFFEQWAAAHDMELAGWERFRYHDRSLAVRAAGCAMQVAYAASPALFSALCRLSPVGKQERARARRWYSPGVPGAFCDHQLIVLRSVPVPPRPT